MATMTQPDGVKVRDGWCLASSMYALTFADEHLLNRAGVLVLHKSRADCVLILHGPPCSLEMVLTFSEHN